MLGLELWPRLDRPGRGDSLLCGGRRAIRLVEIGATGELELADRFLVIRIAIGEGARGGAIAPFPGNELLVEMDKRDS
jgi:hypothetical protein